MKTLLVVTILALAATLVAAESPAVFAEVGTTVDSEATTFHMAEDALSAEELSNSLMEQTEDLADMLDEEDASPEAASFIEESASPKKLAKKAAKAARKVAGKAAALSKLAQQLKKAGKNARKGMLKSKKELKKMAKKLGLSPKQVKAAVKHPKAMAKKAKRQAKKAAKKLKKSLKKAKKLATKFQPKVAGLLKQGAGGDVKLTKQLKKVVAEEPESAAIAKAKNNWAWEDAVFKRLDGYVPPDPKNIKARVEKFELEADEICGAATGYCVQQKMSHPINMKTCVKAKKACFHAKVAVKAIEKAAHECVEAVNTCGRKDWKGKGDCLVGKARCKKLLMATDYHSAKSHTVGKIVRDMAFHDGEANEMRDTVNKAETKSRKTEKTFNKLDSKKDKCDVVVAKHNTCVDNMDKSEPCKKAKKEAKKCKKVKKQHEKVKDKLEDQKKHIAELKNQRTAAEKEALQGF